MGNVSTSCNHWRRLECQCPSLNCNNPQVTNWVHHQCGQLVDINSDAFLRCIRHGVCHITNVRWDCGQHSHPGDFRMATAAQIVYSLTIAASMAQSSTSKEEQLWAQKLILTISRFPN